MSLKHIFFDCDGVILDSNTVKTDAFRKVLTPYGHTETETFIAYHTTNGGISRFEKFRYFFINILCRPVNPAELQTLLQAFETAVLEGLLTCKITPGLQSLREKLPDSTWYIVSGGLQSELRQIFTARSLTRYFNGGIFGSPADKFEIIRNLVKKGVTTQTGLFLGDSKYDHIVATHFNIPCVFVSDWTEFDGWKDYTQTHSVPVIAKVQDLPQTLKSMGIR